MIRPYVLIRPDISEPTEAPQSILCDSLNEVQKLAKSFPYFWWVIIDNDTGDVIETWQANK